jgi:hypothetical protein
METMLAPVAVQQAQDDESRAVRATTRYRSGAVTRTVMLTK